MLLSGAQPPDIPDDDARDDAQLDVAPDKDGRARLLAWINKEVDVMSRFRDRIKLKDRLLKCARMREGRYDEDVLRDIANFGGSSAYARLASNKIRGSYAVLSEIFTQGERPWAINPTPDPTVPEDINAEIQALLKQETDAVVAAGEPQPPPAAIEKRADQLGALAREAALKHARADADKATLYLDDILVEGGFYNELRLFLLDFCTYPVAIVHGPTAVMRTKVSYVNGQPMKVRQPVNEFRRINPHDLLWSAGATRIEDAAVTYRQRLSRAQLASLVGLPGYDDEAIKAALADYASGYDDGRFMDQERANLDDQENPYQDDQYDVLTYMGAVPGWMLEEDFGITVTGDDTFDYLLVTVKLGEHLLKVSIDPDPRARIPFYAAAYEASADSIAGTALPELVMDIEEAGNATLRALINNLGFASGPQTVVDIDRLASGEDATEIVPWKIWKTTSDPAMASLKVIEFFQPNSNVQELMQVFNFLSQLGDEVSAIPRYLTGNEKVGGAGRTASGLSMLMGNASRSMVSIASSIDVNVIDPLIKKLYDLVLLTTGLEVLRGDESIQVKGATYAQTRETDRMRQLEFLQLTNNPTDLAIMGPIGRSKLLRKISHGVGMEGEELLPSEIEIQQMVAAQQQQAAQQAAIQGEQQAGASQGDAEAGPPGAKQQKSPPNKVAEQTDNAQRTRSKRAINPTRRAA